MAEDKKLQNGVDAVESEEMELELDDLDQVAGGSINNVKKKKTTPITDDVASRF